MPAPDVLCRKSRKPENRSAYGIGAGRLRTGKVFFDRKVDVIRFTMMTWFLSCVLVPGCVQALTVRIECVAGCGAGFDSVLVKGAKLNESFGIAFDEVGNGYICEHEGQ